MAYDLLLERFLRYAKINTRSDENATRTPTTQSQVGGFCFEGFKTRIRRTRFK